MDRARRAMAVPAAKAGNSVGCVRRQLHRRASRNLDASDLDGFTMGPVRPALLLIVLVVPLACKPTAGKGSPTAGGEEGGAGEGGGGGGGVGTQSLDKQFYVPAGKFAEVNVQMSAGDEATADYVVDGGSVEWNVHSHPHKGKD